MKTFTQFLTENVSPDLKKEVIAQKAQASVKTLESEIKRILGNNYIVKVVYSERLGKSINIWVYDTKPKNNISMNSPAYSMFNMYLSSNFGRDEDLSSVHWMANQLPRALKFRKITSKVSIDDASKKLIEWFKKNKTSYDSLLPK